MILVTGSTGTVGRNLVRALRARGQQVRALVRRDTAPPSDWDDGVQTVVADLGVPDTLPPALTGVDAVFLLTAVGQDAARQAGNLVDAAAATPIRPRVVFQASVAIRRPDTPVRFFASHTQALDHLRSTGLPWTVMAPNGFMQNMLALAPAMRGGELALPTGDAPVSYVDARDVADAAAEVLTTSGHDGLVHELTGPEALDHTQVAALLSSALGRTVRYRPVTVDDARASLLAGGVDPWQTEGLLELYGRYAAGQGADVTDTVTRLLGRPARTFAEFAVEHARALG